MKTPAARIITCYAGNQYMATCCFAACYQLLHQCSPYTLACNLRGEVNARFPAVGVCCTFFPSMGITIAQYFSFFFPYKSRVVPGDMGKPLCHLLACRWYRFKGDSGLCHVVGINGSYGWGVFRMERAYHAVYRTISYLTLLSVTRQATTCFALAFVCYFACHHHKFCLPKRGLCSNICQTCRAGVSAIIQDF